MLTGCGLIPKTPGKWSHPTNSQAMIKTDHYQCVDEAWKAYPKKMGYVQARKGYWEDAKYATTSCQYNKYSKTTYCIYTPATDRTWIPPEMIEGDENTIDRAKKYSACMTAKDVSYQCIKNNKIVDGSWCGNYTE